MNQAAETLAAEWALRQPTSWGKRETGLVLHVLTQLADPRSDYGPLLDEITQRRWFVGVAA